MNICHLISIGTGRQKTEYRHIANAFTLGATKPETEITITRMQGL